MSDGNPSITDHYSDFVGEPVEYAKSALKDIWSCPPDDEHEYNEWILNNEVKTNSVEEEIFKIYPEFYTKVLPRCQENNLDDWDNKDTRILLMDGLSIREYPSIEANVDGVLRSDLSVTVTPTRTETYRQDLFGDIRHENIERIRLVRTNNINNIRDLSEGKILWCMIPDDLFGDKSKTGDRKHTHWQIRQRSINHIKSILEKIPEDRVVITSDHGYVFRDAGTQWQGDIPKSDDFGQKRYITNEQGNIHNSYMKLLETDSGYSVIGRYNVPKIRQHGGVSLLENIVPKMVIKNE